MCRLDLTRLCLGWIDLCSNHFSVVSVVVEQSSGICDSTGVFKNYPLKFYFDICFVIGIMCQCGKGPTFQNSRLQHKTNAEKISAIPIKEIRHFDLNILIVFF